MTGPGGDAWPEFPDFEPDLLDEIAALETDLEEGPGVLGEKDVPDSHADRPPPGPGPEDGPQDVDPV